MYQIIWVERLDVLIIEFIISYNLQIFKHYNNYFSLVREVIIKNSVSLPHFLSRKAFEHTPINMSAIKPTTKPYVCVLVRGNFRFIYLPIHSSFSGLAAMRILAGAFVEKSLRECPGIQLSFCLSVVFRNCDSFRLAGMLTIWNNVSCLCEVQLHLRHWKSAKQRELLMFRKAKCCAVLVVCDCLCLSY